MLRFVSSTLTLRYLMVFSIAKVRILIAALSIVGSLNKVVGQQAVIDSLTGVLNANTKQDVRKVNQLNELAYENFSYNAKNLNEYSRQALMLAKQLNYKKGEAEAYKNLALSYMLIHGDVSALNCLHESLKLYSSLKDSINIAGVTNYIGCFYAAIKDYNQALPYFLKSEKILGDRKHILRLTILSNTGSCYEDLGQYDKARNYYDQVRMLANSIKDYDWIVASRYQTASLLLIQKDYEKALAACNDGLAIINQHHVSPREIQTLYMLAGDIYYALGNFSVSRGYYARSEKLAEQMNSREKMAAVYYKYHKLDSIAGDNSSALLNFKRYQVITDSVINQSKNEIVALYKVKFAVEEQADKSNRLVLERKADQKIIFYQRWILLIALGSLIIIGLAFLRLKKLNHKLLNLNNQIASQNTQLEELNGIKNKIFSVIAHDLRNPFAQFITLLELVENQLIQADDLVEVIPSVNKTTRQTMEMMDNLLVWSKSQMNGFRVNRTDIDLAELVDYTLVNLQNPINDKELRIRTIHPGSTTACADKDMICIVLRNLLSNAIKFTPARGCIEIESFKEEKSVGLVIRDSGVGMSEDQLNKLFSFNIRSTQGTANEVGTGLGLKICYDLLDLNSGQIRVESSIGRGSCFFVTIPQRERLA